MKEIAGTSHGSIVDSSAYWKEVSDFIDRY
jgi:hypothetical protein